MRKIIGIIVCLWVSLQLSAVSYQPCKSVYRSPGSYSVSGTGYSGSGFRSTSAYQPSSNQDIVSNVQAYHTMSSISASNFEALNSEGGACYNGPRRGRPKDGDNSKTGLIGGYDFQSPVGDALIPLLLLALGYAAFRFRRLHNCRLHSRKQQD